MLIEVILYSLLFRIIWYALGEPTKDFNEKSILSFWIVILANRRLKKMGESPEFQLQKGTKGFEHLQQKEIEKVTVNNALNLFTYENMLGVCGICTGCWFYLPIIFLYGFKYMPTIFINFITIKYI